LWLKDPLRGQPESRGALVFENTPAQGAVTGPVLFFARVNGGPGKDRRGGFLGCRPRELLLLWEEKGDLAEEKREVVADESSSALRSQGRRSPATVPRGGALPSQLKICDVSFKKGEKKPPGERGRINQDRSPPRPILKRIPPGASVPFKRNPHKGEASGATIARTKEECRTPPSHFLKKELRRMRRKVFHCGGTWPYSGEPKPDRRLHPERRRFAVVPTKMRGGAN